MIKRIYKTSGFIACVCLMCLCSFNSIAQTFTAGYPIAPIANGKQNLWGNNMVATLGDSVYVVWSYEYDNAGTDVVEIYFAKSEDRGNTFNTPVKISNSSDTLGWVMPSIAVNNAGEIFIAYTKVDQSFYPYGTFIRKSDDGGINFNNEVLASATGVFPAIAAHNNFVYLMMADMFAYPLADFYFARSTDGGATFEPTFKINDAMNVEEVDWDGLFSLCVNKNNGVIHAAFTDGRRAGGKGDIYYAKSADNGQSFFPNVPVSDITGNYADSVQSNPRIAVGPGGETYVVFLSHNGDQFNKQHLYFTKKTSSVIDFETPVIVRDTNACYNPNLAVSDMGVICVSYDQGAFKSSFSYNGGNSFIHKNVVVNPNDPKCSQLSFSGETLHAVWREESGNVRQVYYTRGDISESVGVVVDGDIAELNANNVIGNIQWQSSEDGETWQNIAGATTNPYSYVVAQNSGGRIYFRAQVSNSLCTNMPVSYSSVSAVDIVDNVSDIQIGNKFRGGIVFQADMSGNGTIGQEYNMPGTVPWGCKGLNVNADSNIDGIGNSATILSNCTDRPIAASLCDSSTTSGYSDWFLPATDQLVDLRANYEYFPLQPTVTAWTSTQSFPFNSIKALSVDFYNLMLVPMQFDKDTMLSVRCIRQFTASDTYKTLKVIVNMINPVAPVQITQQPSDIIVCDGDDILMSFGLTGSPLFFQWKLNGYEIPGAVDVQYMINNADLANEGNYSCIVYNFCDSLETQVFNVKVIDLELNAGSDFDLCKGSDAVINATFSTNHPTESGTITYAWTPASTLNDAGMLTPTASPDTTTSYSIVATDANGCIASDDVQIIVSEVFNDESICIVSVDTLTWKNKVVWKKTSGVGTESFNIYKETAVNVYDLIGNVDYADEPLYVDAGSSPEAHGDKYKITAVDTCGEESDLSPYHKTMNLTIAASGNTMGLNWDNYVDESGTFVPARYYIFRGSNPNLMTLKDSVSGSFTSYNDVNVFVVYHYLIGVKKLDDCGLTKSSQTMSYSNKKDNSDFIGIEDNLYSAGIINISPNPMSTFATLTIPNFKSEILNSKSETGTSVMTN